MTTPVNASEAKGDDAVHRVSAPAGPAERAELLVALGERAFPDLTDTEQDVLRAAAHGRVCDVAREEDETLDEDAEWGCWEAWPERRKVRGTLIRWVCTEPSAIALIDPRGVRVRNAFITGESCPEEGGMTVDLSDVSVPFTLALQGCALPHTLALERTKLRLLDIRYSFCAGIRASSLIVESGVWMHHVSSRGCVVLREGVIGGSLLISDGSFACARDGDGEPVGDPSSIVADGLKVGSNVLLDEGFTADARVSLLSVDIGGNLRCAGGSFACAKDKNGNPIGEPHSIRADGIKIGGNVLLIDGFTADGMVRFLDGDIRGNFQCSDGSFACARAIDGEPVGQPRSLNVNGLKVGANVTLSNGFNANGEVALIGACIGGDLDLIGGSFACARYRKRDPSPRPRSLIAQGLIVGRFSFFSEASFPDDEIVDLTTANLGHLVDDESSWPDQLLLTGTKYDSILAKSPLDAKRRLEWLARHDRTVKGFGQKGFDPQPYHQLASVLRRQGHEKWADQILTRAAWKRIGPAFRELWDNNEHGLKRWRLRGQACVTWIGRWILGLVVGHGYNRARPLAWLAGFVLLGWIVFSVNAQTAPLERRMQPTQSLALKEWSRRGYADVWVNKYPDYSPLTYSLDTFLPLVNLHQDQYWTPRTWWVKRLYLPFHVISGWVVTT
ncbi:MAG: hypothetical protein IID31_10595, partial [Planctomycetes bacterium]|nr:hypothetical protein [Planctomycetota bacterium]